MPTYAHTFWITFALALAVTIVQTIRAIRRGESLWATVAALVGLAIAIAILANGVWLHKEIF